MKKVLYITANPNTAEVSFSKAVGDAFIEAYQAKNPQDEVIAVDLFQTNVPMIDGEVMDAWGKLAAGVAFTDLTESQQQKIAAMNANLEQFMSADRYVFATPMWNFSYPPVVKAYIDNLAVAGKTFKYTENGPVGLLEGKKALHIQATGGIYSEGPAASMDFGRNHLQAALAFFGVTDTAYLPVEGMGAAPDKAVEIKEAAIAAAKEAATKF
ncbi:FMN-dependent NADH-azoreductase [Ectobacillus sp. JY-23]|uniref:FMN-dependent NADH-azoreductase n=1 Tax=Ectobacillus sp. JY-23 TaxID=2933872 RepID=UPI001FF69AF0|nr:FMN-dependent NADH-azoreductase [Ectobacillus sp. JY-23]UOY92859.1 FMN-dependent NADH-azoreductase [Ectobacillus sp. JY-23]